MPKINLDNIQKQLERAEAEYEDAELNSKPMSLSPIEIILNPENTAAENDTAESIQQLADSIEAAGLIHPLTVNKISEHKYMLLSGERRYKAITTHLHWSSIPCTVYELKDTDMVTLVTVQANMETREYTVAERLKLYHQLEGSLRTLKAKGKYKGGISRGIAKMLGISEQQVGKYKRLSEQLGADELKQVTNIDKAIQSLPKPQKTESDFQFFNGKSQEPTVLQNELLDGSEIIKKLKKTKENLDYCLKQSPIFSDTDLESLTVCKNMIAGMIAKYTDRA